MKILNKNTTLTRRLKSFYYTPYIQYFLGFGYPAHSSRSFESQVGANDALDRSAGCNSFIE